MIVVLLSSSSSLKHVMNFGCFPESPGFTTLHWKTKTKTAAGWGGPRIPTLGNWGGGGSKAQGHLQIQGQPGTLRFLSQINKKQGGAPL